MTETLQDADWIPTDRPVGCPYNPPMGMAKLREEEPLSRLRYAGGHEGWIVTSHSLARAVLADPRFSSRFELLRNPVKGAQVLDNPPPMAPGYMVNADPPHHTRYRRQLMGQFTVRRMRLLTERVEQVVADRLDALEKQGPPTDLVPDFCRPIPAMMIGEILGVSPEDRDLFYMYVNRLHELRMAEAPTDEVTAAYIEGHSFVSQVVLSKREHPTDDVFSDLLVKSDFTDEEVVNVAIMLLGAGLDSIASTLALGTMALLQNPEQAETLRREPEITERAVEELLRYSTVLPVLTRAALEDVEIDGHLIHKGETVTLATGAANRDPDKFQDPDMLDITRTERGHVAFGHGVHQCVAQQLARVELTVAFPALFRRFPTLRLAVEPNQVPLRDETAFYGLHALPVEW